MNNFNVLNFAIAIIVYNPDENVMRRIEIYNKITPNLIVIDNSDRPSKFENNFKKNCTWYVRMNENFGMSVALSKVFEIAWANHFDFLLTMDQDSEFSKDKISEMLNYIKNHNDNQIAIYCPNYCRLFWNKNTNEFEPTKLAIPENSVQETDFSMTSGSFFRVSTMVDLVPLTNYFIGYVDNDICFSLLNKGFKIVRVGNINFEQQVGSKVNNSIYNRNLHVLHHKDIRYTYMIRNNLLLQQKYCSNLIFRKTLRKSLLRSVINIIVGERYKLKKLSACVRGYHLYKRGDLGVIGETKDEK